MTPDEIQAARAIIEAATPGKWFVMHSGSAEGCVPAVVGIECERIQRIMEEFVMTDQKWIERHEIHVDHRRDYSDPAPDAAFIAAARTLLPQALDAYENACIQVLQGAREIDSLRQEHERLQAITNNCEHELKASEWRRFVDQDGEYRWLRCLKCKTTHIECAPIEQESLRQKLRAAEQERDHAKEWEKVATYCAREFEDKFLASAAREKLLVEALEFYGGIGTSPIQGWDLMIAVMSEGGARARAALAERDGNV